MGKCRVAQEFEEVHVDCYSMVLLGHPWWFQEFGASFESGCCAAWQSGTWPIVGSPFAQADFSTAFFGFEFMCKHFCDKGDASLSDHLHLREPGTIGPSNFDTRVATSCMC